MSRLHRLSSVDEIGTGRSAGKKKSLIDELGMGRSAGKRKHHRKGGAVKRRVLEKIKKLKGDIKEHIKEGGKHHKMLMKHKKHAEKKHINLMKLKEKLMDM